MVNNRGVQEGDDWRLSRLLLNATLIVKGKGLQGKYLLWRDNDKGVDY